MGSQLVSTTVVSSMCSDHPLVPGAQTSWVVKLPSEIPIAIVTRECETELGLQQGCLIHAQKNPEGHDRQAESPHMVGILHEAASAQKNLDRQNPTSSWPSSGSAAQRRLVLGHGRSSSM